MVRALPTRHRATRSLLTLVTTLALLSACSDEQPAAAPSPTPSSPTASASPSEAATPSEGSAPEPPGRPRGKDTPAARRTFARHVVDVWGYALSTNDATAVIRLSPKGTRCQGCRDLQAELARRERQGWFVDFPGVTVRSVDIRREQEARTYTATASIDIPASRSYYDDGSFRNDNAAHPKATFVVRMRHQRSGFELLAFTVR